MLPAILHADITGLSTGLVLGLPSGVRIENPYKMPMLVDEIRVATAPGHFDRVRLQLKYGRQELTAGFVQLPLIGRTLNWSALHQGRLDTYVWRFAKPIFLPAGASLQPTVRYQADSGAGGGPVTVHITMAGRALPASTPTPALIDLPYIAKYETPYIGPNAVGAYQSTENDLKNPFSEPLNVERLLFAIPILDGTADGLVEATNGDYLRLLYAHEYYKVRFYDSRGAVLLRDLTAIGDVMSSQDRSWRVNVPLASGAYFTTEVEVTTPALHLESTNSRLLLAMHGHRRIAFSELGV